MNLPVEEAIKTLKAEIIAQDWRISPKRAEIIDSSLSCLQQHFKERKATHAMLGMAVGVLEYIKSKGGNPPATIDFLKEAMAHVVGQYEDLKYDPQKEDEIFKTLFHHFTTLKEKIQTGGQPAKKRYEFSPSPVAAKQPLPKVRPQKPVNSSTPSDQKESLAVDQVENSAAEKLIEDLKDSLEKAGAVGSTIGDLLNQLIASQAKKELAAINDTQEKLVRKSMAQNAGQAPPQGSAQQTNISQVDSIKKCPPTELRQISIDSVKVAILETIIAAIKPVKKSKLSSYIQNSGVPLKDFNRLFKGLAAQFNGPLNKVKASKLKKISLPLMVPRGINLPELADENSTHLVFLSNGNWHGIIACTNPDQQPKHMVKFEKSQNGDIAGTGYLEDETEVTLCDSLGILRREGFLITPT